MTAKEILRVLHGGSKFMFRMLIVVTVLRLGAEVLTNDGRIGGSTRAFVLPHHSNGIPLPVDIRIGIPDSIVNIDNVGSRSYERNENKYFDRTQKFDSLYRDPKVSKSVIRNEVEIVPYSTNKRTNEMLQLTKSNIEATGLAYAKFSNSILNWTYIFINYLQFFLFIFIIYQIKQIFSFFEESFSFDIDNINRIKNLGYLIIGYILFSTVVNYSLIYFNGVILIESFENGSAIPDALDIAIYPTINFNWTILVVGFSLIVLSSLLKLGNNFETENDLTI